jgi:hypothetical protein
MVSALGTILALDQPHLQGASPHSLVLLYALSSSHPLPQRLALERTLL